MKKKVEKIDNEIYEEIGKRLKNVRERLGFSQLHIANTFNIGYQSLRRYEDGKTPIPIHFLAQFAEYCDIQLSELIPTTEKNKEFNKDVLLEKNIFQLRKIYERENDKTIKITNAAIDFLVKIKDII
jgi:transcriptional regulator with XRE-family HTH domain